MEWKKVNKQYQPHKKKSWKKKNTQEAGILLSNKRNKILHIQEIVPIELSSDEEDDVDDELTQTNTWDNEGLWYLSGDTDSYNLLMDRSNSPDETLHGVSDG